jgi:primosomal protein N' (replication factor Y)
VGGGLLPPGLAEEEASLVRALHHEGPMTVARLQMRSGLRDAGRWVESLVAKHLIVVETEMLRARVRQKEHLGIRLLSHVGEETAKFTAAQRRLIEFLPPNAQPVLLHDVLLRAKTSAGVAKSLALKGFVEIAPLKIYRLPLDLRDTPARRVLVLTEAQDRVYREVLAAIGAKRPARFLLHGVTGSGKTEIYLRLIADVLNERATALLLVPEIGLTPLLSRIAVSHFPEKVGLLHSGMSPGERLDQWSRIRDGDAPVVVGARSAVFAPLKNLRLVIIDEEQDTSYKQDESPCYHAREVAWHRLQKTGGVLLMGSATPSVEAFHAATRTGEIGYLSLEERIEARPLPEVEIVDMRLEFQRHGKGTIVSHALAAGLKDRLERGEQAIVLLNRRGYSRSLLCRSCGYSYACPDCSVSMTYHREGNTLTCHYCGLEKGVPAVCSNCGGEFIYLVGVGTEQLEEMLRKLLPGARIARLDRDSTRRRGVLRRTLLDFSAGSLDILVGTQMLAKGHDFPNVTLVGVVGADSGLSFPDFRSAERSFQLLTQVAGRAGRGDRPGRVVMQSFYPDHYALRFARRQDYSGFFSHEIEFRQLLGYPPFTSLIQLLISDATRARALTLGEKVATALRSTAAGLDPARRLHVLGPAPAPLEKLRGKYRIQLLLKAGNGDDAIAVLERAFSRLGEQRFPLKNVHVDVDPLSLL